MANNDAIFRTEDKLVSDAEILLEEDRADLPKADYLQLLDQYKHLLKTTKRLVKFNDRSADRLSELARETQEKNAQLEGL